MIALTGTLAECQSLASRVDTACGLPCCHCYAAPVDTCPCELHHHPDGSPAEHADSCTITYDSPRQHPTDPALWAYAVDAGVAFVLTDAEAARVGELDASWTPQGAP